MMRTLLSIVVGLSFIAPSSFATNETPENPIVEIQKKMVSNIKYYEMKVSSDCLQQVKTVVQFEKNDANTLLNCIFNNYQRAGIVWVEKNTELINSVITMATAAVDNYLPAESSGRDGRLDQQAYVNSAHRMVINYYQRLGQLIENLYKAGILGRETALGATEKLNASLRKASEVGTAALETLSADKIMSPEEVRVVLSDCMSNMFEPVKEDFTTIEKLIFESRVELNRSFSVEMQQPMYDYTPVAEKYRSVLIGAFEALMQHATTVWASLDQNEIEAASDSQ